MMERGAVVTSVLEEKQSEGQNKVSSFGSKDEEAIRAERLEGLAASYSARRKVAALQRRLHSLPVGRENPEDAAGEKEDKHWMLIPANKTSCGVKATVVI